MKDSFDLICIGTALVDSIIRGFDPEPVSASGFRADSGSLNIGGEAVNEAMAAAKLGVKTGIFCSLGADDAGDMVAGALHRCGVDIGRVLRSDTHPTPVTTMFVNADGTRKSITNGAHRYNFHPERDTARFTDAKAIILGSLFRAPFDDPEIISAVLRAAKAAGQLVFADTKLPNFRFLTLEDLRDSLPLIDYITPNEAVQAVDATGAGDNFAAGFAAEILRGAAVSDALRFANACGAICASAVGAGTALKNREQVLRLLDGEQAALS